ncbi:hypothetical protein IPH92_03925 [Candidatus Kaiserbacteria bacterium]|nr:MAG: hypothetical protein IPH92_03925 [Candidatus Kaiserbacteria bacterium]
MKFRQGIIRTLVKSVIDDLLYNVRQLPGKIKRQLWNKRILLWWSRLWIRKDEFHSSLSLDTSAMIEMTKDELAVYLRDIVRRRNIAHNRDLEGS